MKFVSALVVLFTSLSGVLWLDTLVVVNHNPQHPRPLVQEQNKKALLLSTALLQWDTPGHLHPLIEQRGWSAYVDRHVIPYLDNVESVVVRLPTGYGPWRTIGHRMTNGNDVNSRGQGFDSLEITEDFVESWTRVSVALNAGKPKEEQGSVVFYIGTPDADCTPQEFVDWIGPMMSVPNWEIGFDSIMSLDPSTSAGVFVKLICNFQALDDDDNDITWIEPTMPTEFAEAWTSEIEDGMIGSVAIATGNPANGRFDHMIARPDRFETFGMPVICMFNGVPGESAMERDNRLQDYLDDDTYPGTVVAAGYWAWTTANP